MENDLSFLSTANRPDILAEHIMRISAAIQKEFVFFGVQSILCTGAASRGELSVVQSGGCFIPYGDYDLYVCCTTPPPPRLVDNLCRNLNKELFGGTDPSRGPLVDINIFTLKNAPEYNCDISTYDRLNTYKVLYGADVYADCTLDISDVPAASFLRVLLNRFSHLTVSFSTEFCTREPNRFEQVDIDKNIIKTWAEIGAACSWLAGRYSPWIGRREISAIVAGAQKLGIRLTDSQKERIAGSLDKKIRPASEGPAYDDWKSERVAAGTLALRVVERMVELTGVSGKSSTGQDVADTVYRCVPQRYFSQYIWFEIDKRIGNRHIPEQLLTALSVCANLYERYRFFRKNPGLIPLFGDFCSPIFLFYYLTIRLFYGSREGKTCVLEDSAKQFLFKKTSSKTAPKSWEDVRTYAKSLWDGYAGRTW